MTMPDWLERALTTLQLDRWAKLKSPLSFEGHHVSSRSSFGALLQSLEGELKRRHEIEASLAEQLEAFVLDGYCAVCARSTRFWVDRLYGFPAAGSRWPAPNWRERMVCEHCQLNNRMRAALHYLLAFGRPNRRDPVYITEQVTPLFKVLKRLLPNAVGSEYLGHDIPSGTPNSQGVRNETLTALSFRNASFRFLLSFDVIEHVSDADAAIAECRRVLQPGGWLVFTVPFDFESQSTLKRASVNADGSISHHVTPEYHGDPLNAAGILSFYTFGWDLMERLNAHGFKASKAFVYWSEKLGYLGGHQILFSAQAG
jgi:SAM-dependent methyltransferase